MCSWQTEPPRKPRTRDVVRFRPEQVLPDRGVYSGGDPYVKIGPDWEIYNAPRPLYGTVTWVSPKDGIEGWFFAAIDPKDEYADRWRQETIALDGCLLHFIEPSVWNQMVEDYAQATARDLGIEVNEFDFRDWEQSFRNFRERSRG